MFVIAIDLPESMQDLFKRYLDNQCSPEEVTRFLAYFKNPGNESELRALIIKALEDIDIDDGGNRWNPALDEGFAVIKRQMVVETRKTMMVDKPNHADIAATVILGGLSVFI
jgi:hypothetical protein